jgi:hypothetical protein
LPPIWACAGAAINASIATAAVKVFIASVSPPIPARKPTLQPGHGKQGIGMAQYNSPFRGRGFSNC